MEDFDSYESADNGTNTASSSLEVSEKFKEGVKKAGAKAKKIQKDEKKAKKYDIMLSSFLIKIILDKRYDDLLVLLFICLDKAYPSNFLLGIFSLIYEEISLKIRETSEKSYQKFNYTSNEQRVFNNEVINNEIKIRINFWVEDMIDVVLIDSSELTTKKLLDLIEQEKKVLDDFFIAVFVFFFREINIIIKEEQAFNYIDFISEELKKAYRKHYFSLKVL